VKMGLDTLKREGVATWLLVILASVVVLAVGYKILHATTQVLIHLGAYAMSDGYRTHPHGNRSELQACRMSKPRDAGDGRHANHLRLALGLILRLRNDTSVVRVQVRLVCTQVEGEIVGSVPTWHLYLDVRPCPPEVPQDALFLNCLVTTVPCP
jgi:hypothetical protein